VEHHPKGKKEVVCDRSLLYVCTGVPAALLCNHDARALGENLNIISTSVTVLVPVPEIGW